MILSPYQVTLAGYEAGPGSSTKAAASKEGSLELGLWGLGIRHWEIGATSAGFSETRFSAVASCSALGFSMLRCCVSRFVFSVFCFCGWCIFGVVPGLLVCFCAACFVCLCGVVFPALLRARLSVVSSFAFLRFDLFAHRFLPSPCRLWPLNSEPLKAMNSEP